ncbi:MAG TPA: HupE/UreJ family protein [Vicinamibacterales bacterium]|nr:HupE/UreJ family protein [Vicinamibacterales bacterium]
MRSWLALFALLLVCAGAARAHDLPVNTMVNAFVRVDRGEADLVARVPMDLLRGIPFPTVEGRYDLAQSGPFEELARTLLADAFVLAEDNVRLKPVRSETRIVAVSDRSFDRFDHALAAARASTGPAASVPYDTGYLDVHFVYPVKSTGSRFEIQSQVAVDVGVLAPLTVRFVRGDVEGRAMIIPAGADPVDLDPAWYRAAGGFIVLGIEHILTGTDHLLFLLCLVVPVRRLRAVVPLITAFTIAHSVTLIASALGFAPRGPWFPPLVEAAIAASIVYTALENVVTPSMGRRELITCLFGLVHGFGFSNALGDSLQLAGQHLIVSLLSFNVGIEIGQLGVLCVMLPLFALLRRWMSSRRLVVLLSTAGGILGAVWLVERWQVLWQVDVACSGAGCLGHAAPWLVASVALLALVPMLSAYRRHRIARVSRRPQ